MSVSNAEVLDTPRQHKVVGMWRQTVGLPVKNKDQTNVQEKKKKKKREHLGIIGQREDTQNHKGCAKLKASKKTYIASMPLTMLPSLQHVMTCF